jgi:hypothetical protein
LWVTKYLSQSSGAYVPNNTQVFPSYDPSQIAIGASALQYEQGTPASNPWTIKIGTKNYDFDLDSGSPEPQSGPVASNPLVGNGSFPNSTTSSGALVGSEPSPPSQQASLLWGSDAKLHAEMGASLHDALVPTSNDTPLLYDSHSALFSQAMASFGSNDFSTAHDTLLPGHGGFHELATSDTHTLALTPAASSTETMLAVPHHA